MMHRSSAQPAGCAGRAVGTSTARTITSQQLELHRCIPIIRFVSPPGRWAWGIILPLPTVSIDNITVLGTY